MGEKDVGKVVPGMWERWHQDERGGGGVKAPPSARRELKFENVLGCVSSLKSFLLPRRASRYLSFRSDRPELLMPLPTPQQVAVGEIPGDSLGVVVKYGPQSIFRE